MVHKITASCVSTFGFLCVVLLGCEQVTGFVGAERLGWEILIERMGGELCKTLKKRVTSHLVCKEVRGRDSVASKAAPGAEMVVLGQLHE